MLDALAAGEFDSPAGTAAALTGAFAAGLVAATARSLEASLAEGAAVQAKSLGQRLWALAGRSADAHRRAVDLLGRATQASAGSRTSARDELLAAALLAAADVALAICEAAADVVTLASWIAAEGPDAGRADVVVAATIAEAAVAGAAELVSVNLAVQPTDERTQRAHGYAQAAATSRRSLGKA